MVSETATLIIRVRQIVSELKEPISVAILCFMRGMEWGSENAVGCADAIETANYDRKRSTIRNGYVVAILNVADASIGCIWEIAYVVFW